MKTTLKKTALVLMIVIMAISAATVLSGCGGPTTLEEYVNSDTEVQKQLDSLGAQLGEGGSVTVSENNIAIVYKYPTTYDKAVVEQMKTSLESAMQNMDSTFQNLLTQLKDESGIDAASLSIEYQNGDGTVLYNKDFK